jgi:hypothetical protein
MALGRETLLTPARCFVGGPRRRRSGKAALANQPPGVTVIDKRNAAMFAGR